MKTATAAMQTHLDQSVTSLATCFALERPDGTRILLTDHDQDITVLASTFDTRLDWMNDTYLAATGFERSAVDSQANNVDNAALKGILNVGGVTAADIKAGKFDGSRVYVFVCNWSDLSMGAIKMPGSGVLGKITIAPRAGVYEFELNGLAYFLRTRIGELYTPTCRVDLFSKRCRLDESTAVQHAVVSSVTSRNIFVVKSAAFTTFTDTAIPITNDGFETGIETDPSITGWLAEESFAAGQWATVGSGAPFDSNRLESDNVGPHDEDREYRIASDAATIPLGGPGPVAGDIDAGETVIDLVVSIAAAESNEARIGLAFLDGSGGEICRAYSRQINNENHGLSATHADYTRRFVVPPNTRDIKVLLGAYNTAVAGTSTTMVWFDEVRPTIKAMTALALGTDRDTVSLPDWFDHGLVIFRSGTNQEVAREIESYVDGTSTFTVFFSLPFTPAVGDVIEIYPGCKKSWADNCAQKWDNGINFQAEPFVPSQDQAFDSVNAK